MLEPKYVEANGVRFAYLEQGTGPLVLLVHGFPDTAYTWDAILPAVAAAGFRAVAFFTRGYLPTAIPADGKYDADTLGRDVIALIEALGAKRAIVVGHDFGATAAYAAAALAPERLERVITVAIPHPHSIKSTPRNAWGLRHVLALKRRGAAAMLRRNDFAYTDTLVQRWSPAWDVPATETQRIKAAFREPLRVEAALGYYRDTEFRPRGSMQLPITVPAIAFAGEQDSVMPPRAFEKARHCFTASYEVVQMPGGHFMHREHPEHFTTELLRALS